MNVSLQNQLSVLPLFRFMAANMHLIFQSNEDKNNTET